MFTSSKVAIFSDLHLGVHNDSGTWHNIALEWVEWFTAEIDKRDIKDIIFCGDLFHYRDAVALNTMSVAQQIFSMFTGYNIVMIPGNHDSFFKDNASINSLALFKGHSNITVIDTYTELQHNDTKLTFCPWGTVLAQMSKCDIMFGHFDIQSFKMNSFKVCDHGFQIPALLDLADTVISGHFHQRSDRKLDEGRVLYVGNPFQQDFGDCGTMKGIYFLDLDTCETEFVRNQLSPQHIKLTLSELVCYKRINDTVKTLFNNNIVKFTIDRHMTVDDSNKLFTALHQLQPIQLNVEHDATFNAAMDGGDADLSGIDMKEAISEFVNLMDLPNKSQVQDYTIDLYEEVLGQ